MNTYAKSKRRDSDLDPYGEICDHDSLGSAMQYDCQQYRKNKCLRFLGTGIDKVLKAPFLYPSSDCLFGIVVVSGIFALKDPHNSAPFTSISTKAGLAF